MVTGVRFEKLTSKSGNPYWVAYFSFESGYVFRTYITDEQYFIMNLDK